MLWFFKKKKDEEEINKVKEYITITDENGVQVEVLKDEWLDNVFKPFIEENKDNADAILDMLDLAIGYKVKEVVLYASIEYDKDKNIVTADRLFKAYELNGLYKEAEELYEDFGECNLTSYMYYDLAMVKDKLNDKSAKRKYLYLAFKSNNNNEKAIKALLENEKNSCNEKEYYDSLVILNDESNSYYLSKELAKLQYEMNKDVEAVENIAKALKEAKRNEKHIKEIAKILLENNKLNEFENHIVPLYDKNSNDLELHSLVQFFYFKDKQYKKGLELLKELYSKGKFSDGFALNEKKLLQSKLFEEDHARYAKFISGIDEYSNNYMKALNAPIYSKGLGIEVLKKSSPNIIMLPFTTDKGVGSYKASVKDIIKTVSTYLYDLIYLNTDIDIKNVFMFNSLGAKITINDYDDEYFVKVKEKNADLDYILTGTITDVEDENFLISFYIYDANQNKRIVIYETKTNVKSFNEVLQKFVNRVITDTFFVNVKKVSLVDVDYIDLYSEYLLVLLNVNRDNKNRIYSVDKLLRDLLTKTNNHKLYIALSVIATISEDLPEIKENYRSKIYEAMVSNKTLYEMLDSFKIVYGEDDE